MNWQRNSRIGTEPEKKLVNLFQIYYILNALLCPLFCCQSISARLPMGSVAFLHNFQVNSLFSKRNAVISFLWGKKNHNMRGEMIGIIRLNGGIEHNGENIFYEDHLSTHFCSLNDVLLCSGKQIHLIKSKTQMAAARKKPIQDFVAKGVEVI